MKFILLFGPSAVGKMTVGQELMKITNFKLLHNHMTMDLANQFFDFSTKPFNRLTNLFRTEIVKEVANSDLDGLIFTFVWALDLAKEEDYIESIIDIFRAKGAAIYYVELEADLEERLKRNIHEHRLQHKPSKRNTENSERILLREHEKYQCNSVDGEFSRPNYIKINNTHLAPAEVAKQIKDYFAW